MIKNKTIIRELSVPAPKICERTIYSETNDFKKLMAFFDFMTSITDIDGVRFDSEENAPVPAVDGIVIMGEKELIEVLDLHQGDEVKTFLDTPFHVQIQHIDNNRRKVIMMQSTK